ncbi:MAG: hypothetical protein M1820_000409 [Bogoriella megaspora]|nr:MAG: hypothetical protein M1820_000409 [Bogoriella megaspora]
MPTKDSEPRRRKKDRGTTKSSKDNDRHSKSSKSSRRRASSPRQRSYDSLERTKVTTPERPSTSTPPPRATIPQPDMERRTSATSLGSTRAGSMPYPSFSRAHSKEAVGTKEINPRLSLYTPEHTDVGHDGSTGDSSGSPKNPRMAGNAPPSPPLTNTEAEIKRQVSGGSMRYAAEKAKEEMELGRRSVDSGTRPIGKREFTSSQSSLRNTTNARDASDISAPGKSSKVSDAGSRHTVRSVSGPSSHPSHRSATDSDRTSVAPEQPSTSRQTPLSNWNLERDGVDSPSTPTARSEVFSPIPERRQPTPGKIILVDSGEEVFTDAQMPNVPSMPIKTSGTPPSAAAPPPPPPPPIVDPVDAPRVDYLLQKGGLSQIIPRNILASVGPQQPYRQYGFPRRSPEQASVLVQQFFSPMNNVLDDYTQVLQKHGSIAVATGYRSVARRLLDRLEEVFNRNISSEVCNCVMCQSGPCSILTAEEDTGISWGEILELVSGRRELPQWPPFSINSSTTGLGISGTEAKAPMQNLDIDVPEEYREHYLKQSKKTKSAVQKWLSGQPEVPSSPPTEVDDETLTFAMLTHLEPEERHVFTAHLKGASTLSNSRAGTPLHGPQSEHMARASLALTRLYRLGRPPRDPEIAIFLLKNKELHNVLMTLAAVSEHEWDILISGRFDGFLWSGAELSSPTASRGPSRGPTPAGRTTTPFSTGNGPSRGTTPFNDPNPYPSNIPSRGPTPASAQSANFPNGLGRTPTPSPAPVALDEEAEMAAIAETERSIYQDMEILEDHFEALHQYAENVRRGLRARHAALSLQAQQRRSINGEAIEVRMSTPASNGSWFQNGLHDGMNGFTPGVGGWDSETESVWGGIDDAKSELAPDDSASNISYNRHRRRAHRSDHHRRTPAVKEEDEGSVTEV